MSVHLSADTRSDGELAATYEAHFDLLVGIAVSRFGIDRADGETLAHEVFLAFLTCVERIHDQRGWLVSAIFNASKDYLRRAQRTEPLPENGPDPQREAFARLTPRCQLALRLRHFEGDTIPDIATVLGTTSGVRKEARQSGAAALSRRERAVSRMEEFVRLARQLEVERDAAAELVPAIVADVERLLDEPLRVEWRTLGVVEGLCAAARTELVHSPGRSLHIAQMAVVIGEALPESYPHLLRVQFQAQAWKAVSNAHRFTSRYRASLLALDTADRRIANEPALAHDRATLSMARAVIFREMGRTDEVLVLLDAARETFRNYRDFKQVARCELVIGMTQHRLGKFADARQTFQRVIPAARAEGDLHTVAAAYNNLGRTAADAGDVNGAVDALQQARAIFRELDMPTEIARTSWSIGVAQLAASRFGPAISILSDARVELLRLGMPENAGLAGVDLIEALLATNEGVAARELAATVVDEFRRAGLDERALQAVSYLR